MLVTRFLVKGLLILQEVTNNIGSKGCTETFSAPGLQNPVFCPVVRFFKNSIFGIYTKKEFLGAKVFPDKKCSASGFSLKCSPTAIYVINYRVPQLKLYNSRCLFFHLINKFLMFKIPFHIL